MSSDRLDSAARLDPMEETLPCEEASKPGQTVDRAGSSRGASIPSASTLGGFFRANWRRVLVTYGLFNVENVVHLARPWVLGLAINDLLSSSCRGLTLLALQQLAHMLLSTFRQMYDTRAFTAIYSELATQLVVEQRARNVEVSRVAARSAMSREIVDFFEREVPYVLNALYSVVGALVMLGLCDWLLVPFCLALLCPVSLLSVVYGRKTCRLNARLNDQFEREVEILGLGQRQKVREHYECVAHWRIRLSDCQALSFGLVHVLVLALMGVALVRCCLAHHADTGQIFAVLGYVMMFSTGLFEVPVLVQQLTRLRDINRRMHWGRSLPTAGDSTSGVGHEANTPHHTGGACIGFSPGSALGAA